MVERQTAIKVTIKSLIDGEYVEREGWNPNFIRCAFGEVSRANIMGVITQKVDDGYMLDDGSGQIKLKTYENPQELTVGVPIMVIGRPRVYTGELFVNYEIVKEVSPGWLEFRKQELAGAEPVIEQPQNRVVEAEGEEVHVMTSTVNIFTRVIDAIRKLDKENGNQGADVDAIISEVEDREAEHVINNLLEEGEIFEIKPGRVKVLE